MKTILRILSYLRRYPVLGSAQLICATLMALSVIVFPSVTGHVIDEVIPRPENHGQLIGRSARGLVAVYNMLPRGITAATSVAIFQTRLQMELKVRVDAGMPDWPSTYSPRMPLRTHPLRVDASEACIRKELESFWE